MAIGPETVLGAVERAASGETEAEDEGGFGATFSEFLDTRTVAREALIEDAVASGGDSTLWTDGEEDDERCPPGDPTCKDEQP